MFCVQFEVDSCDQHSNVPLEQEQEVQGEKNITEQKEWNGESWVRKRYRMLQALFVNGEDVYSFVQ